MTRKIFRSICIVTLVVSLLAMGIVLVILYGYFSRLEKDQLKAQTELIVSGVEAEGDGFLDYVDLEEYRITRVDAEGEVLYDSAYDAAEMENHLDREEIAEAFESGYGESSRRSDTLTERYYYCAALLSDGTVIRVAQAQSSALALFLRVLPYILIIAAAAIVAALILSRVLSKKIVKPLNDVDLDHPLSDKNRTEDYKEIQPLLKRIDAQQKQLEKDREALEKTDQIRQEFTANVSHELKTPLHSISGYSELMAAGVVKTEDIPRFSRKIYDESQRMTNLVDDILYLGKLDQGATDMMWEMCDLYEIAKNAVETLRPVAEKSDITIFLDGESAIVHGIPQLLESIVYNLCDNAVKYNNNGGIVNVEVKNEEGKVRLTVKDNGVGISKQDQERIFERFYRVDKSRSKAVGGTGLGLSIVKHAAMIHKATIKVDSVLGMGSRFTVIFSGAGNSTGAA